MSRPSKSGVVEQDRALRVDEIPALLTDNDLRRVLGIGWTQFYGLKKRGRFAQLIAHPVLTTTPRYSGVLVKQWVSGTWPHARSFGRRTA